MLRPLINSSIGFFFGIINDKRPLCKASKMLPTTCNTSSDVLLTLFEKRKLILNKLYKSLKEFAKTVSNVLDY